MQNLRDDLISDYRFLTTFDDVIAELGGVVEVSKLTKRSRSAVCNWRNNGERFPAAHYLRIRKALHALGCKADLRLYTFQDVDEATVDIAA
jgi:hypothetical protein